MLWNQAILERNTAALRALLLTAAALAIVAFAAVPIDLPIARWLQSHRLGGDLHHTIMLCEAFGFAGNVGIILIGAAAIDPRSWRILPYLAAASLGSGLLADVAKLFIGRLRPNSFDFSQPITASFGQFFPWRASSTFAEAFSHANQSFPSAHTAVAVGLAIGLARLYPRGTWFFIATAGSVAVQRMVSHSHYLSDCLAGAAIACVFCAILEWINRSATTSPQATSN